MRSKWAVWPLALVAAMLMLAMATTAVSAQGEDKRPSQPLLQDYYSGTVKLLGAWAPMGTAVVACVDACETYQTKPVAVELNGRFTGIVLAPTDRRMIGRDVTFHLINSFGSIQADQTFEFFGVYDLYTAGLTFSDPLPVQQPTPGADPNARAYPGARANGHPRTNAHPRTDGHPRANGHPRADRDSRPNADGDPPRRRRHRGHPHPAAGDRRRCRPGRGRPAAALRRRPPGPQQQPLPPQLTRPGPGYAPRKRREGAGTGTLRPRCLCRRRGGYPAGRGAIRLTRRSAGRLPSVEAATPPAGAPSR